MCRFYHYHKPAADSVHCLTAVQHHNMLYLILQKYTPYNRSDVDQLVSKWYLCVRMCVCVYYELCGTPDRKSGLVVGSNAIQRNTHRRNLKPDTHIFWLGSVSLFTPQCGKCLDLWHLCTFLTNDSVTRLSVGPQRH